MSDSDSKSSSAGESDEEVQRSGAEAPTLPVKKLKELSKKEILEQKSFYMMEGAEDTDDDEIATPTQKISFNGKAEIYYMEDFNMLPL